MSAINKVPLISRADYNTILLHTEKISNGQHDFISVLRRELCDKLRIADAESLIFDLVRNKDVEFLNRVRLFLSQFSFVVVGDDGAHYQLVKRGNFCELDFLKQTAETVVDNTKIDTVSEYEPNPDSELNSKPIQESDESVDDITDELKLK